MKASFSLIQWTATLGQSSAFLQTEVAVEKLPHSYQFLRWNKNTDDNYVSPFLNRTILAISFQNFPMLTYNRFFNALNDIFNCIICNKTLLHIFWIYLEVKSRDDAKIIVTYVAPKSPNPNVGLIFILKFCNSVTLIANAWRMEKVNHLLSRYCHVRTQPYSFPHHIWIEQINVLILINLAGNNTDQ